MSLWAGSSLSEHGLPSQFAGLSPGASLWPEFDPSKKLAAAVAVLFAESQGPGEPARLVLTRRTLHVGSHKGQIGFAGGRREESELTADETAIRELNEELGVPPESVTVHGVLEDIRSIDGGLVRPVVMTTSFPLDQFVPSEAEVAHVIAEPWTIFQRSESLNFRFNLFGLRRESHLFKIAGTHIWGLTARIIYAADFR